MTAGDLCGRNRRSLHKGKTLTSDEEIEDLQGTSRKQSFWYGLSGMQK